MIPWIGKRGLRHPINSNLHLNFILPNRAPCRWLRPGQNNRIGANFFGMKIGDGGRSRWGGIFYLVWPIRKVFLSRSISDFIPALSKRGGVPKEFHIRRHRSKRLGRILMAAIRAENFYGRCIEPERKPGKLSVSMKSKERKISWRVFYPAYHLNIAIIIFGPWGSALTLARVNVTSSNWKLVGEARSKTLPIILTFHAG